jgi:hypothetical protein
LHILEGLQYNYLPSILNQILISFYATAKNLFGRILFYKEIILKKHHHNQMNNKLSMYK